jgi:hypothetical protein
MATEDHWDGRLAEDLGTRQKCGMFHVELCTCICVTMFMYVQGEYNETTQTSYETNESTPKSGQN